MNNLKIAFFGTPEFAVTILQTLKVRGLVPNLIVTNPDRPKGRKLVLTPPPVKVWAEKEGIKVVQPEKLRTDDFLQELKKERWDLFIVAAYGSIIPPNLLELPLHQTLNIHPSLLPHFRGASPIQSAILADEKETGVSIMLLDEEMDHGPVLGQKKYSVNEWPTTEELQLILGKMGGELLADIIPEWTTRKIKPVPQDHAQATFTKKITKQDGLINLTDDPYLNFRKIQAFSGWPGTYFFQKDRRIVIKKARYGSGQLEILRVVPEGKKEINFTDL